jgi:hypothetical protein
MGSGTKAELNEYAAMARQQWEKFRPAELAQLEDQDSYFSMLGQQAADQIEALTKKNAGPDVPGEGYMGKLQRLETARFEARGAVIRDLILVTPEDEESQEA